MITVFMGGCYFMGWAFAALRNGLTAVAALSILSCAACLPLSVQADQRAIELPELFESLKEASTPAEARRLESIIWEHWLESPDKNSGLLMSQVRYALSAEKLDVALLLCNQLIDSTPDFAEAWNKRATIHYLMGSHEDSVADIRETLRLEPRHFGAISGLGMIFLREGNLEAALEAFEQVLLITPASVGARQSVEFTKRQLGREI